MTGMDELTIAAKENMEMLKSKINNS